MVDTSCLFLLLLAIVVAEWARFRERVGGIRIALTSPWRLLIAAVFLSVVRHAIAPRPAIWADLPKRVLILLRARPARAAGSALIGTRPAILFVGYLAVVMIGYNHGRPPLRLSENEVANLQVRWDMAWYFDCDRGLSRALAQPARPAELRLLPGVPDDHARHRACSAERPWPSSSAGTLVALGAFFWGLTMPVPARARADWRR